MRTADTYGEANTRIFADIVCELSKNLAQSQNKYFGTKNTTIIPHKNEIYGEGTTQRILMITIFWDVTPCNLTESS
jgi:hypothetical protein